MIRTYSLLAICVLLLFNLTLNAAINPVQARKITAQAQSSKIQSPVAEAPKFLSGKVIVKYKSSADIFKQSPKKMNSLLSSQLNTSILDLERPFAKSFTSNFQDRVGLQRIFEIAVPAETNILDLVAKLNQRSDVEYAEPVYERTLCAFTPNDPLYSLQYAPQITECPKAWDITKGSPEITIAVVDGGVFVDHQDLMANIWTNDADTVDGIDNDGNGYIDDYMGWDFVGNSKGQGDYAPDNNPQPSDTRVSHGTHVSGCAAGVGNNGVGICGPAFQCKIIPIKCGSDNPQVVGIYNGYRAIVYAAQLGADVINCSWGGTGLQNSEQDAINQALSYGTVIVAAAGNEGHYFDDYGHYPSMLKGVISIGASTNKDKVANFSNYGWQNCVYAPGASIYATLPGNTYGDQDGTSMASPVAAGIVALVKSIHPDWDWKQIYHQIRSTSVDAFSNGNETARALYYGRINAYNAVTYNNPNFPEKTIPGVSIENYTINADDAALTSYGKHTINVTLKNYLAKAENLKVTILPFDDFITINQAPITYEVFDNMEEKSIAFNINLTYKNPWFDGIGKVMLKYEAGEYVDYEVISIPIKILSTNSYSTLQYISPAYYISWLGGHSPAPSTLWLAGYSAGYQYAAYYIRSGTKESFDLSEKGIQFTCAYGFDGQKGIFGTAKGSLYSTFNMGENFTPINVATITGFVNDIHFFDDSYGIILGDPMNNTFGVGYSANAGASWKSISKRPAIQAGETGLVGSVCYFENNAWFGTTSGRVLRSTDRGQSWDYGTVSTTSAIAGVAFSDKNNGLALYGTQNGAKTYLARSTDGGATWSTDVYDFADINEMPMSIFATDASKAIIVHTELGKMYKTEDLGKTWTTILTAKTPPLLLSTNYTYQEQGEAFCIGDYIGLLKFNYGEEKPSIAYLSSNPMIFDSTEINKTDVQVLKFENTGNTMISIDDLKIEAMDSQEKEFTVFSTSSESISPGATLSIRVKFAPEIEGLRTAKLTLKTKIKIFEIILNGYAYPAVGVIDDTDTTITFSPIRPNPTSENAQLEFHAAEIQNININMYNSAGAFIQNINNAPCTLGPNVLNINTENLPTGAYLIRIEYANTTLTQKLIIQ